jgi:hypothetical protein
MSHYYEPKQVVKRLIDDIYMFKKNYPEIPLEHQLINQGINEIRILIGDNFYSDDKLSLKKYDYIGLKDIAFIPVEWHCWKLTFLNVLTLLLGHMSLSLEFLKEMTQNHYKITTEDFSAYLLYIKGIVLINAKDKKGNQSVFEYTLDYFYNIGFRAFKLVTTGEDAYNYLLKKYIRISNAYKDKNVNDKLAKSIKPSLNENIELDYININHPSHMAAHTEQYISTWFYLDDQSIKFYYSNHSYKLKLIDFAIVDKISIDRVNSL